MTGGKMHGTGYRAAMEPEWDYGTYAILNASALANNPAKLEKVKDHLDGSLLFHAILGWSFLKMSPGLFEERRKEVEKLKLPLLGVDGGQNLNEYNGKFQELLFSPIVTYTYSMYSW
jgi:hypothetical protein